MTLKGKPLKKFLFLLSILFLVSGAYAQKINLIGGMSFSRYHVEGLGYIPPPFGPVWRYKPGFIQGIGIEFKIIKRLSLEADVLYFQKGSNYTLGPGSKLNYNLNTISFPLLVKFAFLPDSLPYILTGGEFSIILSHMVDGRDLMESTEKHDYGILLGVGYDFKIPRFSFFIEARYHIGLTDIEIRDFERKTRALALIIGIKI